jgi:hypothetical protein
LIAGGGELQRPARKAATTHVTKKANSHHDMPSRGRSSGSCKCVVKTIRLAIVITSERREAFRGDHHKV